MFKLRQSSLWLSLAVSISVISFQGLSPLPSYAQSKPLKPEVLELFLANGNVRYSHNNFSIYLQPGYNYLTDAEKRRLHQGAGSSPRMTEDQFANQLILNVPSGIALVTVGETDVIQPGTTMDALVEEYKQYFSNSGFTIQWAGVADDPSHGEVFGSLIYTSSTGFTIMVTLLMEGDRAVETSVAVPSSLATEQVILNMLSLSSTARRL